MNFPRLLARFFLPSEKIVNIIGYWGISIWKWVRKKKWIKKTRFIPPFKIFKDVYDKCFPRRGVSLEGDPIARSRQVEPKQATLPICLFMTIYLYLSFIYLIISITMIFRQQRRGSNGRPLYLWRVALSHLFCWWINLTLILLVNQFNIYSAGESI